MEVLKTISPQASPWVAHERPRQTRPSSRARIAFAGWGIKESIYKFLFDEEIARMSRSRLQSIAQYLQSLLRLSPSAAHVALRAPPPLPPLPNLSIERLTLTFLV